MIDTSVCRSAAAEFEATVAAKKKSKKKKRRRCGFVHHTQKPQWHIPHSACQHTAIFVDTVRLRLCDTNTLGYAFNEIVGQANVDCGCFVL